VPTKAATGLLERLREDRVIAVVRAPRVADPAGLATALAGNGVRCVEFTFTITHVLSAIRAAAERDALVGAGAVLDPDQAHEAIDAGARFVVTPAVRVEVADACHELDVPVVLGAFTPTEVRSALEAGAAAIKLFPARMGGPEYVRDLLGPFPNLALVPSGGVGPENMGAYLEAGAVAVSLGTSLAPPDAVESGDLEQIVGRITRVRATLQGVTRPSAQGHSRARPLR
jgi:2-dehydro-3-deoxyphosphogluconate aldolase/(4S)-4-hydroxy-2-oxoglutarate aldolase